MTNDALVTELRSIWARYEPQRAEAERLRIIRTNAAQELEDLNERRRQAGLPEVDVPRASDQQAAMYQQAAMMQNAYRSEPVLTWKEQMDEELLAAVKRFLRG